MKLADAERNFIELVERVYSEGISVELERDDQVIACLTPSGPRSPLTIAGLNAFLDGLPSLGDDADGFAREIQAIRAELPVEESPWD